MEYQLGAEAEACPGGVRVEAPPFRCPQVSGACAQACGGVVPGGFVVGGGWVAGWLFEEQCEGVGVGGWGCGARPLGEGGVSYQEFKVTLEYDDSADLPWLLAISDDEVRSAWQGTDIRRGFELIGRFIASSSLVRDA